VQEEPALAEGIEATTAVGWWAEVNLAFRDEIGEMQRLWLPGGRLRPGTY